MPNPKVIRATRPTSVVRQGVRPASSDLAAVQDDVRAGLDAIGKGTPFKTGKLFTFQFAAALDQEVLAHNLGGAAKGFILVDVLASPLPAASPVVWRVPMGAGRDETHVTLACSEPCTVTVWVWR